MGSYNNNNNGETIVDLSSVPLYSLVGQHVGVSLMDGSTRQGIVYTVDPYTKNLVLIQVEENGKEGGERVRKGEGMIERKE
jgi:small nuclear ribonucleoprotein (snRNP)-like protein